MPHLCYETITRREIPNKKHSVQMCAVCDSKDVFKQLQIPKIYCCGQLVESTFGSIYDVCTMCGKSWDNMARFTTPISDYMVLRDENGSKTTPRACFPSKRRISAPLTNFMIVLNSFLGQSGGEVPRKLMNRVKSSIDVHDRDAPLQIRALLKSVKAWRTYYKDIYKIIYQAGGREEKIKHFQGIQNEFNAYVYFFNHHFDKKKRNSMFSNWGVLKHILQWMDLPPYYNMPEIAASDSKQDLARFLNEYSVYRATRPNCPKKIYEECGYWPV